MHIGHLPTVFAMGTLLAGCGGGAATCPEPATPQGTTSSNTPTSPAAAPVPAAAVAPRIQGIYRAVEVRQGKTVTNVAEALLSQAPSCYAMRMLWTFEKDTLGISLDLLCDTGAGTDHSVDLCQASLEIGIQWTQDGFEIPVSARSAGSVDRFALKFEQIPGGMKRTRNKINRSCNVSTKASTLTVQQKGDTLVLSSPDGDMVFAPEPSPRIDWGKEAQALYEERHGTK